MWRIVIRTRLKRTRVATKLNPTMLTLHNFFSSTGTEALATTSGRNVPATAGGNDPVTASTGRPTSDGNGPAQNEAVVPPPKKPKLSEGRQETKSIERRRICPSPKKNRMHRMYSSGQKHKVACYARQHGIRSAARHYNIHHRNVSRWMKLQLEDIKCPGKRANKKGQGRKISYPQEIEEKLVSWILQKREESLWLFPHR